MELRRFNEQQVNSQLDNSAAAKLESPDMARNWLAGDAQPQVSQSNEPTQFQLWADAAQKQEAARQQEMLQQQQALALQKKAAQQQPKFNTSKTTQFQLAQSFDWQVYSRQTMESARRETQRYTRVRKQVMEQPSEGTMQQVSARVQAEKPGRFFQRKRREATDTPREGRTWGIFGPRRSKPMPEEERQPQGPRMRRSTREFLADRPMVQRPSRRMDDGMSISIDGASKRATRREMRRSDTMSRPSSPWATRRTDWTRRESDMSGRRKEFSGLRREGSGTAGMGRRDVSRFEKPWATKKGTKGDVRRTVERFDLAAKENDKARKAAMKEWERSASRNRSNRDRSIATSIARAISSVNISAGFAAIESGLMALSMTQAFLPEFRQNFSRNAFAALFSKYMYLTRLQEAAGEAMEFLVRQREAMSSRLEFNPDDDDLRDRIGLMEIFIDRQYGRYLGLGAAIRKGVMAPLASLLAGFRDNMWRIRFRNPAWLARLRSANMMAASLRGRLQGRLMQLNFGLAAISSKGLKAQLSGQLGRFQGAIGRLSRVLGNLESRPTNMTKKERLKGGLMDFSRLARRLETKLFTGGPKKKNLERFKKTKRLAEKDSRLNMLDSRKNSSETSGYGSTYTGKMTMPKNGIAGPRPLSPTFMVAQPGVNPLAFEDRTPDRKTKKQAEI